MIFSEDERLDARAKRSTESRFEFYERSARPEMANIRNFMNEIVAHYPAVERDELIARLKSGDDDNFNSAEFELLLFTVLTRAGFLLEPHPAIPSSDAKPDFLVTCSSGKKFYLEAVVTSESTHSRINDPLIASLLDRVRDETDARYFVIVQTKGYPTSQPSARKLIAAIRLWLNGLREGDNTKPKMIWSHEDLELSITAIPKPARDGPATTLLAGYSGGAGWINTYDGIKEALKHKGGKYGKPDLPFVVAVNNHCFSHTSMEEECALFGPLQVTVNIDDDADEGVWSHSGDGAWVSKGGPIYRRVSAAWIFGNCCSHALSRTIPTLYLNPWAERAIPGEMLRFDHAQIVGGGIVKAQGDLTLQGLFAVSDDWPNKVT